jgi:hypothetical protein
VNPTPAVSASGRSRNAGSRTVVTTGSPELPHPEENTMVNSQRPNDSIIGEDVDVEGHRVLRADDTDDTEGHRVLRADDADDTEGHRVLRAEDDTDDDTEGHRVLRVAPDDGDDDTEGHRVLR